MESPEEDLIAINAEDYQITRKRKLDEDGFVCPTTPDIPKSSHHYVDSRHQGQTRGMDCVQNAGGNFSQTESVSGNTSSENNGNTVTYHTGENFEQYKPEADNQAGDNQTFQSGTTYLTNYTKVEEEDKLSDERSLRNLHGNTTYQSGETGEENILPVAYDTNNLPNEEGAAAQEGTEILHSLFRGFEQESSIMLGNWSKIFRQCGEYETACQQRLEELNYSAKSIEDSMNSKKDQLCNRLRGIGKTFET